MKNILVLLFLGAIGYLVWQRYLHRDPAPVRVFKETVENWAEGDMGSIRPMCANPMVESAFEYRSAEFLTKPQTFETVVEYKYEDVTVTQGDAANEYKVSGRQLVFYNPPGIKASAYASWRAVLSHTLHLQEVAGEWQITEFATNLVEQGEHRFAK
ncbi:MAG: hypothetical protein GF331_17130 [Chitinivibrionales bacterium]|nr:hypothetical protein [Chitinivibrionales bacterium]